MMKPPPTAPSWAYVWNKQNIVVVMKNASAGKMVKIYIIGFAERLISALGTPFSSMREI
jgi:hypothetical protein